LYTVCDFTFPPCSLDGSLPQANGAGGREARAMRADDAALLISA